jgi:hypothetical protein
VVINLLDQKLENPNPDFFSYTLSKAALKEATKLLAICAGAEGDVVGIAPGITLASNLQSDTGFAEAHRRTRSIDRVRRTMFAQAAVYLANAEAVTGTVLLSMAATLGAQLARRDVSDRSAGRAMSALLLDARLADCRRIFLRNYVSTPTSAFTHTKRMARSALRSTSTCLCRSHFRLRAMTGFMKSSTTTSFVSPSVPC